VPGSRCTRELLGVEQYQIEALAPVRPDTRSEFVRPEAGQRRALETDANAGDRLPVRWL
jgi:hypothetical protein